MVCQYQHKMDISVWAMRVRCTTIITFSSVLFPFRIIISNTCYSWHAHHVNGWTTSANGWSFYARHVSDFGFKGFLGVVLLASCSVYFGYKECVPVVGLHFPSECVPSLIGLHLPCIQSNDLSYTVFVCQVSSPMICPTWSKYLHHAFWEPSMQICCSFIAVSSIGWAVSTSHIFIEESEGLLS